MAGEWIKIEAATANKPEILRLGRLLGIEADAVFGKMVRLWGWFDSHSVDGVVDGVVAADIDAICKCPGFTAACASVGWLTYDDQAERVSLPNFDRHNGETAKQRALKTRRQANWRKSVDGKVDAAPSTKASTAPSTREEKRREEEKKEKKPAPKRGQSIDLKTFLAECEAAGEEAIPADDAVFAYAQRIGLPADYVALAWAWFKVRYADKKQAGVRGWRQTFRNAVEGNWPKYWYAEDAGGWGLTTAGKQARAAQ